MNLNSQKSLISRLRRSPQAREQFVESHLRKGIANQLLATRDRLSWSQERLGKEVGMTQNAISRLESSGYGRPTLTTLRKLAAALDVGLIVRFVPFSEMVDWVSGTPRVNLGLNSEAIAVPNFAQEEELGVFDAEPAAAVLPSLPSEPSSNEVHSSVLRWPVSTNATGGSPYRMVNHAGPLSPANSIQESSRRPN